MYLLTKSETLNVNADATLTGAADAGNIIDGDVTTAVETTSREPVLNIIWAVRRSLMPSSSKATICKTTTSLPRTTIARSLTLKRGSPFPITATVS